jgi:hypothetical protein
MDALMQACLRDGPPNSPVLVYAPEWIGRGLTGETSSTGTALEPTLLYYTGHDLFVRVACV